MNTLKKENYVVPGIISVKLVPPGFFCTSETTGVDSYRLDYGDPENIIW